MLEDTVTCDDIYLQNAAEGEEEEGEDMTRQDGVSQKENWKTVDTSHIVLMLSLTGRL